MRALDYSNVLRCLNLSLPLVTVFIPVYNSEDYVAASLDSILNQTYSNLEILIINDGSSDQTEEIICSYDDSRIRLLNNDENRGIPYTRNRGLEEARGKYLAVMDADDLALKNRMEVQVNYLEKNPEIDAVGSYFKRIGNQFNKVVKRKWCKSDELQVALLFFNRIANPTAMIRLASLEERKMKYNESFFVAQDYELWSRLTRTGKVEVIPEVLMNYRTGHDNVSKTSRDSDKQKRRKQLIDRIHEDLLLYYGFPLNDEDLLLFKMLFNDTPPPSWEKHEINQIPDMINKLRQHNIGQNLFQEQLFQDILNESLTVVLSNQPMRLMEKIRTYFKSTEKAKTIEKLNAILFLSTKHFYRKLRS
jgi:glycosyltransferase involved in cell wall biosynthesis